MKRLSTQDEVHQREKRRGAIGVIVPVIWMIVSAFILFPAAHDYQNATDASLIESTTQELASSIDMYIIKNKESVDDSSPIEIYFEKVAHNGRGQASYIFTPSVDGNSAGTVQYPGEVIFEIKGNTGHYFIEAYNDSTTIYKNQDTALIYDSDKGFINKYGSSEE